MPEIISTVANIEHIFADLSDRINLVESYPMNPRPFLDMFNSVFAAIPLLQRSYSKNFGKNQYYSGYMTDDFFIEYSNQKGLVQAKIHDYRNIDTQAEYSFAKVYFSGGITDVRSGNKYLDLQPSLCFIGRINLFSSELDLIHINHRWSI